MAYWEFLLQKEGDRDWLPLETAHVEISEGRYRIIAHTNYCEAAVDICLQQVLADQVPPRRKTLKRRSDTNTNGLMVVIPFTHLTPGNWSITCSAAQEAASEPPQTWQYGVQLEVLAIESGVEYWDTDLDEAEIAADMAVVQQSTDSPASTMPEESTTPADALSASANASSVMNVSAVMDASPAVDALPSPSVNFDALPPLEDLPLRLQLQHQAIVANAQSAITLPGQIVSFSAIEGLPGEGTLWLQLRNPETSAIVHQAALALSIAQLPCRFDLPITLPGEVETRLLVGELSLWTATEPPQILAIQGFTVTLNLDALLEVVANQGEHSPTVPFEDLTATTVEEEASDPAEADEAEVPPPVKALSTLSPREIPFRLVYLPSTGLTLPPVIYRPMDKKAVGAPSLPKLGDRPTRDRSDSADTTRPDKPAKPLDLPPIGNHRPTPETPVPTESQHPRAAVNLPPMGRRPVRSGSQPAAEPLLDVPLAAASAQPDGDQATDDPTALAFQPDFQGRFWNRLSALAEEAQKAAADQKAQLEAAGIAEDNTDTSQVPEIALPFPTFPDDLSPQNYEVVIYDEPAATIEETVDSSAPDTEPIVEVLQPGDPEGDALGTVPIPDLVLPQGELVAGAPLPISIRLPIYPRRLAVKVWVTDMQSRTLVDRPRWLMKWTPDGDEQTALLQLQVPLGSIEAQFDAIAIDLATQQESYKTTHVRSIVPTAQPNSEIDPVL